MTVTHTLRDTVARISQAYSGLMYQQAGKQGEPRIAVVKMQAVRANFETMHTLQQVCVRRPDQDCDRDQLWRERIALVDLSKLALEVTLDETRFVSDDKTVGVAILKCGGDGCWNVRLGGSGGNIRSGRPSEPIHCRIGDGCKEMKRELEQLIALAHGRPDANATPPSVEGAQRKEPVIIGDATMTEDRTIIVRLRRTADGIDVSGVVKYPVGDPSYLKVLNHLGGMNPGDTKLVPAWDDTTPKAK